LRTPQTVHNASGDADEVTFENYDDQGYGYLRVIVDPKQLRIEYHPADDGVHAKTPDDYVTIDLASRKRTIYTANNLGYPERAAKVREKHAAQARRHKSVG
jgi:hypothetical protein